MISMIINELSHQLWRYVSLEYSMNHIPLTSYHLPLPLIFMNIVSGIWNINGISHYIPME